MIGRNYLQLELYDLIKSSEEIFDFIQESSLDGLWYWNLERPEDEWMNPKFWTVLGYDPDEMPHSSSSWQSIIHPEDLKAATENLAKHCENPDHPYDQVVRYTHKDGSTVWIRCRGLAIRNEKGKAVRMLGAHHNITDLKRKEQALEMSRERFEQVASHSRSVFWEVDTEGVYTYVSNTAVSVLGYTPEELVGKIHFYDLHPQNGREEFKTRAFDAFARRKDFRDIENPAETKTGQHIWLNTNGIPVYNKLGNWTGYRGIDTEITDRRKNEELLRILGCMFESKITMVVVTDAERRTEWANEAFWESTGYRPEEFLGKNPGEMLQRPRTDPELKDRMTRAFNEGNPFECEIKNFTKNGSLYWIHMDVQPVRDSDGSLTHFVSIQRDITDRKQAEEALRESEYRFRSFVENADDIIYALSLEGLFTYLSPNWLERMGEPAEDALGKSFEPYIHPDDVHLCRAFLEKVKNTGENQSSVEYRVRHRDGSWRWHVSSGSAFRDSSGNITGYVGIARDVTEAKRAEQDKLDLQNQLNQSQKMESVGRLAGGVAHDFNNLLMGLMGYIDMCGLEMDADHPSRKWLNEMSRGVERCANLTRQLLAFASKQTISPQVLNLNEVVGNMLKMLRRLIGEDIHLVWTPGEGVGSIEMDPGQVDQILANLCVNARDAIGGVGRLHIKTENITLDDQTCKTMRSEARPGEFVLLSVSDDGCGMDADTLTNIFEPFFTTKGVGEGTGLGLATVYGIIKQNDGFIQVYSEKEKGSTFRIFLPRVRERERAAETEETSSCPRPGGTETILLVEDEKVIRETIRMTLDHLGYNLLLADSPETALRLAAENPGGR